MGILNVDIKWGYCMGILNGEFKRVLVRIFEWGLCMWILVGEVKYGFKWVFLNGDFNWGLQWGF